MWWWLVGLAAAFPTSSLQLNRTLMQDLYLDAEKKKSFSVRRSDPLMKKKEKWHDIEYNGEIWRSFDNILTSDDLAKSINASVLGLYDDMIVEN